MGPRLCSRGEMKETAGTLTDNSSQWGHGFVAVESTGLIEEIAGYTWVAMGPRLCSRGEQRPTIASATIGTRRNGATAL